MAASLVLCAVFVPSAFVAGISGQFFRQFAVTIAVSTVISLFVSLTLSPALAAVLMRGHDHGEPPDAFTRLWNRVLGGFFRQFNRGLRGSDRALRRRGRCAPAPRPASRSSAYAAAPRRDDPAVPERADRVHPCPGPGLPDHGDPASRRRVARAHRRRGRARSAEIALGVEGVTYAVEFVGFSGATRANAANAAAIFVGLAPFEERDASGRRAPVLIAELNEKFSAVQDGFVDGDPAAAGARASAPRAASSSTCRTAASQGSAALQSATDALVAAGNADPALRGLFTTFRAEHAAALRRHRPHARQDDGRPARQRLRGAPDLPRLDLRERLQLPGPHLPGARAGRRGASAPTSASVARFKTRNRAGEMVSLGAVVDLKRIIGPDRVVRYNLYPAAEINGDSRARGQLRAGARGLSRVADATLPRRLRRSRGPTSPTRSS